MDPENDFISNITKIENADIKIIDLDDLDMLDENYSGSYDYIGTGFRFMIVKVVRDQPDHAVIAYQYLGGKMLGINAGEFLGFQLGNEMFCGELSDISDAG